MLQDKCLFTENMGKKFLSYLSEKKFFTERESCPVLLRARARRKVRDFT